MTRNKFLFIAVVSVLVIFQSCKGEEVYFQKFEPIEGSVWDKDKPVSFDFDILDTNQIYDFYLNLRIGNDYPYSNYFSFWELKSPDGRVKTDTNEFILAKPNGQWLGNSVSGTVIENQMFFLRKKLPIKGTYTFTLIQGMRESKLENIQDVGLKIIRYNEQK